MAQSQQTKGAGRMKESNLYLGLDVHAESIAAVVVEEDGRERKSNGYYYSTWLR